LKKIEVSSIERTKIVKMYKTGKGTREIAKLFPFSRIVVKRILKEEDVKMNNKVPTKYHYNYNTFKVINSREKAYWLGFLYADGFVSGRTTGIRLSIRDKKHLEKFATFIKTNKKVTTGEQDSFGVITEYAEIRIYSIEIVEDLISLGCVERKSLILNFPSKEQVPSKYMNDFIRGYFDGDGSISTNGKSNGFKISIIGTKDFLQVIKEHFGLKVKLLSQGKVWELKFGGQLDILSFVNSIYDNEPIKLDRKYYKSMRIKSKLESSMSAMT